jgi:hypothetical protein
VAGRGRLRPASVASRVAMQSTSMFRSKRLHRSCSWGDGRGSRHGRVAIALSAPGVPASAARAARSHAAPRPPADPRKRGEMPQLEPRCPPRFARRHAPQMLTPASSAPRMSRVIVFGGFGCSRSCWQPNRRQILSFGAAVDGLRRLESCRRLCKAGSAAHDRTQRRASPRLDR